MDRYQTTEVNPNSTWVNSRGTLKEPFIPFPIILTIGEKGAWVTTVIVLIFIRFGLAILPGISSEASWTLTNLAYNTGSFIMFHWISGTPFTINQNEYEGLTLWEQIDGGAQFTPTKKYLTAVPVILFLLSTHYTHYDLATFTLNLSSLLIVLVAKLPSMHKVRLFGWNKHE